MAKLQGGLGFDFYGTMSQLWNQNNSGGTISSANARFAALPGAVGQGVSCAQGQFFYPNAFPSNPATVIVGIAFKLSIPGSRQLLPQDFIVGFVDATASRLRCILG